MAFFGAALFTLNMVAGLKHDIYHILQVLYWRFLQHLCLLLCKYCITVFLDLRI
jgi:hypothetical protein